MDRSRDRDAGLARVASLTRWVAGGAAGAAALIAVVVARPHLPSLHLPAVGQSQASTQPGVSSSDTGTASSDLQPPSQAPAPSPAPAQATSGGS
ncbi:MAG TPA: hypothetical protein VGI06_13165 [Acidimicrobiales bacterium]